MCVAAGRKLHRWEGGREVHARTELAKAWKSEWEKRRDGRPAEEKEAEGSECALKMFPFSLHSDA